MSCKLEHSLNTQYIFLLTGAILAMVLLHSLTKNWESLMTSQISCAMMNEAVMHMHGLHIACFLTESRFQLILYLMTGFCPHMRHKSLFFSVISHTVHTGEEYNLQFVLKILAQLKALL